MPTTRLLNVNELGESVAPELIPAPVKLMVCGLLPELSVIVSVALRALMTVGLNVTLIVQFVPAARLDPQVLVCPKSPGLEPVKAMLVILKAVLCGLESVTL